MIRSDAHCENAERSVLKMRTALDQAREALRKEGHPEEEIKDMLDPSECMMNQMEEEIAYYRELKAGRTGEHNHIGQLLVAARLAAGDTQEDLATRLGISVDEMFDLEHNEYFGEPMMRINQVLEVLGITLTGRVNAPKKEQATEWQSQPR